MLARRLRGGRGFRPAAKEMAARASGGVFSGSDGHVIATTTVQRLIVHETESVTVAPKWVDPAQIEDARDGNDPAGELRALIQRAQLGPAPLLRRPVVAQASPPGPSQTQPTARP